MRRTICAMQKWGYIMYLIETSVYFCFVIFSVSFLVYILLGHSYLQHLRVVHTA